MSKIYRSLADSGEFGVWPGLCSMFAGEREGGSVSAEFLSGCHELVVLPEKEVSDEGLAVP